ncbi:hypothetical protein K6V92_00340 [Cupriavidus respiraculi]|uniref:hypothetical protein n=1 Tax=Cupriavidus respiraculi TaxID=195930 RepID=UPI001C9785ED|nr:hypothetical protein [Cupriavidus respiraculi]MBY4945072.1 hypothetical protein [Cupriavidus respiraculi]
MPYCQHANTLEFRHYAQGLPDSALARFLRCTPATARAWRSGKRAPPWWTVAVLRLDAIEREEMARQMGYAHVLPRLGLVRGEVIEMRARRQKKSPAERRATIPTMERDAIPMRA